jgi:hypothetical protein
MKDIVEANLKLFNCSLNLKLFNCITMSII